MNKFDFFCNRFFLQPIFYCTFFVCNLKHFRFDCGRGTINKQFQWRQNEAGWSDEFTMHSPRGCASVCLCAVHLTDSSAYIDLVRIYQEAYVYLVSFFARFSLHRRQRKGGKNIFKGLFAVIYVLLTLQWFIFTRFVWRWCWKWKKNTQKLIPKRSCESVTIRCRQSYIFYHFIFNEISTAYFPRPGLTKCSLSLILKPAWIPISKKKHTHTLKNVDMKANTRN